MDVLEFEQSRTLWNEPPFVVSWRNIQSLPSREVHGTTRSYVKPIPPWVETGIDNVEFNFSIAMRDLCADVCRHTPELNHINTQQILFGFTQARNGRGHGLQARVTPLRFAGGHLVRQSRGRLFQVQRFVVDKVEMMYLMTFCLPRFFNQDFDEKFVTVFHELFHIGPNFDGDLRRHRGRYCLHTHSKADYDARMAHHARAYLSRGANPRLHAFLRLDYGQLSARHGKVVGHALPRAKILPVPLDQTETFDRVAARHD